MSKWKGAYVCHVCRDCECAFVAEDYTGANDIPPRWRRCPECAEKAGIDYDSQKPSDYWTDSQRERYKKLSEKGAANFKKFRDGNAQYGEFDIG